MTFLSGKRARRDTYNYTLRDGRKVVQFGITNNPERRIDEHERDGKRFTSVTIDFPCSRETALELERQAIETYKQNQGKRPRYNKV